MIASRVPSEKDLHDLLLERGFEQTDETTNTGRFWKNKASGLHVLVPSSVQGFYPSWLLEDLEEHVGKLDSLYAWMQKNKPKTH
jgi:hypothetical protein